MSYLVNGRIPTYRVQDEYELLQSLPDSKPSKRIVKTKKGLRAIKALIDIEQNHNVSWYTYLKERNIDNMDDLALFYRGTKISFKEMFDKTDEVARSMAQHGIVEGDEIGVCMTNTPELVYTILAANKLGVKVNLFGANFDKQYLSSIMDGTSNKLIFVSDDNYDQISDLINEKNYGKVVVSSLADSLPEDPTKCDEYEPELDAYYHYDNKVPSILKGLQNGISFSSFTDKGKEYNGPVTEAGDLETDFLITYTSGSTKVGFPKAIIHKNRSLITMGRFHDPELSGNPKIPGLRGLAHIHPESNTDIITCISDNLMQGWSVGLEPEYSKEKALDYIFLNKPNYLNATTSFMIEAAKQYLIDKKFHKDSNGRKMPFLLASFNVGEGTSRGEEKFINKFLRKARAGSGVSVKGLKLPFTPCSMGGGDCEHGGIYYTLWKSLYQKLYSPILGKSDLGLLPVPYTVVTALKQDKDGNWVECDYGENGVIVANSYSNLSGYKNNEEATEGLIVEDKLGRHWVSCKVAGYIDKVGGVHVRGRIPEKEALYCETYEIDESVTLDSKNILSSTTVTVDDKFVTTLQFQPDVKVNKEKAYKSLQQRLLKKYPAELLDEIYIREIPARESMPLTGSGKRSARDLEKLEFTNAIKLTDLIKQVKKEKQKQLIKK